MLSFVQYGLMTELIGKLEWVERATVGVDGQANATL
jgi:hypothetical protein